MFEEEDNEEQFDIYANLNEFDLGTELAKLKEENTLLEESLEKYRQEIELLRKQNEKLSTREENAAKNISKLFKTAKAEITRKDCQIAELNRKLDDLHFRRLQRNQFSTQRNVAFTSELSLCQENKVISSEADRQAKAKDVNSTKIPIDSGNCTITKRSSSTSAKTHIVDKVSNEIVKDRDKLHCAKESPQRDYEHPVRDRTNQELSIDLTTETDNYESLKRRRNVNDSGKSPDGKFRNKNDETVYNRLRRRSTHRTEPDEEIPSKPSGSEFHKRDNRSRSRHRRHEEKCESENPVNKVSNKTVNTHPENAQRDNQHPVRNRTNQELCSDLSSENENDICELLNRENTRSSHGIVSDRRYRSVSEKRYRSASGRTRNVNNSDRSPVGRSRNRYEPVYTRLRKKNTYRMETDEEIPLNSKFHKREHRSRGRHRRDEEKYESDNPDRSRSPVKPDSRSRSKERINVMDYYEDENVEGRYSGRSRYDRQPGKSCKNRGEPKEEDDKRANISLRLRSRREVEDCTSSRNNRESAKRNTKGFEEDTLQPSKEIDNHKNSDKNEEYFDNKTSTKFKKSSESRMKNYPSRNDRESPKRNNKESESDTLQPDKEPDFHENPDRNEHISKMESCTEFRKMSDSKTKDHPTSRNSQESSKKDTKESEKDTSQSSKKPVSHEKRNEQLSIMESGTEPIKMADSKTKNYLTSRSDRESPKRTNKESEQDILRPEKEPDVREQLSNMESYTESSRMSDSKTKNYRTSRNDPESPKRNTKESEKDTLQSNKEPNSHEKLDRNEQLSNMERSTESRRMSDSKTKNYPASRNDRESPKRNTKESEKDTLQSNKEPHSHEELDRNEQLSNMESCTESRRMSDSKTKNYPTSRNDRESPKRNTKESEKDTLQSNTEPHSHEERDRNEQVSDMERSTESRRMSDSKTKNVPISRNERESPRTNTKESNNIDTSHTPSTERDFHKNPERNYQYFTKFSKMSHSSSAGTPTTKNIMVKSKESKSEAASCDASSTTGTYNENKSCRVRNRNKARLKSYSSHYLELKRRRLEMDGNNSRSPFSSKYKWKSNGTPQRNVENKNKESLPKMSNAEKEKPGSSVTGTIISIEAETLLSSEPEEGEISDESDVFASNVPNKVFKTVKTYDKTGHKTGHFVTARRKIVDTYHEKRAISQEPKTHSVNANNNSLDSNQIISDKSGVKMNGRNISKSPKKSKEKCVEKVKLMSPDTDYKGCCENQCNKITGTTATKLTLRRSSTKSGGTRENNENSLFVSKKPANVETEHPSEKCKTRTNKGSVLYVSLIESGVIPEKEKEKSLAILRNEKISENTWEHNSTQKSNASPHRTVKKISPRHGVSEVSRGHKYILRSPRNLESQNLQLSDVSEPEEGEISDESDVFVYNVPNKVKTYEKTGHKMGRFVTGQRKIVDTYHKKRATSQEPKTHSVNANNNSLDSNQNLSGVKMNGRNISKSSKKSKEKCVEKVQLKSSDTDCEGCCKNQCNKITGTTPTKLTVRRSSSRAGGKNNENALSVSKNPENVETKHLCKCKRQSNKGSVSYVSRLIESGVIPEKEKEKILEMLRHDEKLSEEDKKAQKSNASPRRTVKKISPRHDVSEVSRGHKNISGSSLDFESLSLQLSDTSSDQSVKEKSLEVDRSEISRDDKSKSESILEKHLEEQVFQTSGKNSQQTISEKHVKDGISGTSKNGKKSRKSNFLEDVDLKISQVSDLSSQHTDKENSVKGNTPEISRDDKKSESTLDGHLKEKTSQVSNASVTGNPLKDETLKSSQEMYDQDQKGKNSQVTDVSSQDSLKQNSSKCDTSEISSNDKKKSKSTLDNHLYEQASQIPNTGVHQTVNEQSSKSDILDISKDKDVDDKTSQISHVNSHIMSSKGDTSEIFTDDKKKSERTVGGCLENEISQVSNGLFKEKHSEGETVNEQSSKSDILDISKDKDVDDKTSQISHINSHIMSSKGDTSEIFTDDKKKSERTVGGCLENEITQVSNGLVKEKHSKGETSEMLREIGKHLQLSDISSHKTAEDKSLRGDSSEISNEYKAPKSKLDRYLEEKFAQIFGDSPEKAVKDCNSKSFRTRSKSTSGKLVRSKCAHISDVGSEQVVRKNNSKGDRKRSKSSSERAAQMCGVGSEQVVKENWSSEGTNRLQSILEKTPTSNLRSEHADKTSPISDANSDHAIKENILQSILEKTFLMINEKSEQAEKENWSETISQTETKVEQAIKENWPSGGKNRSQSILEATPLVSDVQSEQYVKENWASDNRLKRTSKETPQVSIVRSKPPVKKKCSRSDKKTSKDMLDKLVQEKTSQVLDSEQGVKKKSLSGSDKNKLSKTFDKYIEEKTYIEKIGVSASTSSPSLELHHYKIPKKSLKRARETTQVKTKKSLKSGAQVLCSTVPNIASKPSKRVTSEKEFKAQFEYGKKPVMENPSLPKHQKRGRSEEVEVKEKLVSKKESEKKTVKQDAKKVRKTCKSQPIELNSKMTGKKKDADIKKEINIQSAKVDQVLEKIKAATAYTEENEDQPVPVWFLVPDLRNCDVNMTTEAEGDCVTKATLTFTMTSSAGSSESVYPCTKDLITSDQENDTEIQVEDKVKPTIESEKVKQRRKAVRKKGSKETNLNADIATNSSKLKDFEQELYRAGVVKDMTKKTLLKESKGKKTRKNTKKAMTEAVNDRDLQQIDVEEGTKEKAESKKKDNKSRKSAKSVKRNSVKDVSCIKNKTDVKKKTKNNLQADETAAEKSSKSEEVVDKKADNPNDVKFSVKRDSKGRAKLVSLKTDSGDKEEPVVNVVRNVNPILTIAERETVLKSKSKSEVQSSEIGREPILESEKADNPNEVQFYVKRSNEGSAKFVSLNTDSSNKEEPMVNEVQNVNSILIITDSETVIKSQSKSEGQSLEIGREPIVEREGLSTVTPKRKKIKLDDQIDSAPKVPFMMRDNTDTKQKSVNFSENLEDGKDSNVPTEPITTSISKSPKLETHLVVKSEGDESKKIPVLSTFENIISNSQVKNSLEISGSVFGITDDGEIPLLHLTDDVSFSCSALDRFDKYLMNDVNVSGPNVDEITKGTKIEETQDLTFSNCFKESNSVAECKKDESLSDNEVGHSDNNKTLLSDVRTVVPSSTDNRNKPRLSATQFFGVSLKRRRIKFVRVSDE